MSFTDELQRKLVDQGFPMSLNTHTGHLHLTVDHTVFEKDYLSNWGKGNVKYTSFSAMLLKRGFHCKTGANGFKEWTWSANDKYDTLESVFASSQRATSAVKPERSSPSSSSGSSVAVNCSACKGSHKAHTCGNKGKSAQKNNGGGGIGAEVAAKKQAAAQRKKRSLAKAKATAARESASSKTSSSSSSSSATSMAAVVSAGQEELHRDATDIVPTCQQEAHDELHRLSHENVLVAALCQRNEQVFLSNTEKNLQTLAKTLDELPQLIAKEETCNAEDLENCEKFIKLSEHFDSPVPPQVSARQASSLGKRRRLKLAKQQLGKEQQVYSKLAKNCSALGKAKNAAFEARQVRTANVQRLECLQKQIKAVEKHVHDACRDEKEKNEAVETLSNSIWN